MQKPAIITSNAGKALRLAVGSADVTKCCDPKVPALRATLGRSSSARRQRVKKPDGICHSAHLISEWYEYSRENASQALLGQQRVETPKWIALQSNRPNTQRRSA